MTFERIPDTRFHSHLRDGPAHQEACVSHTKTNDSLRPVHEQ